MNNIYIKILVWIERKIMNLLRGYINLIFYIEKQGEQLWLVARYDTGKRTFIRPLPINSGSLNGLQIALNEAQQKCAYFGENVHARFYREVQEKTNAIIEKITDEVTMEQAKEDIKALEAEYWAKGVMINLSMPTATRIQMVKNDE